MKKLFIKPLSLLLAGVFALSASALPISRAEAAHPDVQEAATGGEISAKTIEAYDENDYTKLAAFLEEADDFGVKNGAKLSPSYDMLDPETWGAANGEPRFSWVEVNGKLRIQSIRIQSAPGMLCGMLDLSGCTELYLLNCADNLLTGLDVSGCSKLRFLECRWNSIPALDLSSCPELSVLICTDNRIKTLDLTHNPLLGLDHLRMADAGNKFVSCFICQDPEYSSESHFFISANCGEGCTTYNGWYTEDGRYITDFTVFEPTEEWGTRFVARFSLYGAAPGDADGSGSIDLADALMILRISMGLAPAQSGAGADVNGDGTANAVDALLIMRRTMGVN